jgi:hypothetical protein
LPYLLSAEVAEPLCEGNNLAIDGKAELIVKPAQALRVMQVVDAAFAAAEKGCSVACRI